MQASTRLAQVRSGRVDAPSRVCAAFFRSSRLHSLSHSPRHRSEGIGIRTGPRRLHTSSCRAHQNFDPWDIDEQLMPSYFHFEDDPDGDDTHPHVVVDHVMIPMRDGVRLASTVYRPSFGGNIPVPEPLPVVFHRTPYNKDKSARTERCLLPDGTLSEPIENPQTADRFARRGYVVVIQDCRGRYQSEGRFTKYVNEGDDGEDSLEWITSQPWCNGKVGTFGLSYCAHVQLAMACKNPPGLASMFLESGGFWDAYRDGVRYGGAFTMKQVTWAFKNAKVSPEVISNAALRASMESISLHEWFERVHEWFPGYSPLSLAPDYEAYIFHDWSAQYDGEEWQQVGLCARRHLPNMADVPTLIICSWYDPYVGAMSELFNGLRAAKDSEVRMVLGPWTHGDHAITYAGEVDFGPQCTFDRNVAPTFQAARAAWFDEFLHGRLPGASPTPGTSPLPGGTPLHGGSPLVGTSPPAEPLSPILKNTPGMPTITSTHPMPPPPPSLSTSQLMTSLSNLIASNPPHPAPPQSSPTVSNINMDRPEPPPTPSQASNTTHITATTTSPSTLEASIRDTHALLASVTTSPLSTSAPQFTTCFTFSSATPHGPLPPASSTILAPLALSTQAPTLPTLHLSGNTTTTTTTTQLPPQQHAATAIGAGPPSEGLRSSLSVDARKLAFFRPSLEMAVAAATGNGAGAAGNGVGSGVFGGDGLLGERMGRSPGSSTRNSFTGHSAATNVHARTGGHASSLSTHSSGQSILSQVLSTHTSTHQSDAAAAGAAPAPGGAPLATSLPSINTKTPTLNDYLRTNSDLPVMVHTSTSQKQQPSVVGVSPAVATPVMGTSPVSRSDMAFMASWAAANSSRAGSNKAGSLSSKVHNVYANVLPGVQFTPSVSSSAPWHQPMPPVKYFRMGGGPGTRNAAGRLEHGGDWLSCTEWPPAWANKPTVFTFSLDGTLQEEAGSVAVTDTRIMEEGCETDGAGTTRDDEDSPDSSAVASALASPITHRSHNTLPACSDTTVGSLTAHTSSSGTRPVLGDSQGDTGTLVLGTESGSSSGNGGCLSETTTDHNTVQEGCVALQGDARDCDRNCVGLVYGSVYGSHRSVMVLHHDPLSPVPTIGGNITSGEPIMSGGAFDQVERPQFFGSSPHHTNRRMCDHPGVRSWATPPLTCDMELTGVVKCVMLISSDAPDADIHVTLVDEYPASDAYPSGFSMNVASGIARARVRHGCMPHEVSWLQPGQPSVVTVELNVVSNLFAQGHRLRLDVSASSFPRYDINYGVTDEEHSAWARAHGLEEKRARTNTDGAHPTLDRTSLEQPASSNGSDNTRDGTPEVADVASGDVDEGFGLGMDGGYAVLRYAPLSEGAKAALEARRQAAGLWREGEEVRGRPYRICSHVIHLDGKSYVELPARKLDGQGGPQGGEGRVAGSPSGPLIPFSPIWLQRRPTWSR